MGVKALYLLSEVRGRLGGLLRQLILFIPILFIAIYIMLVGSLPSICQILFLCKAPYDTVLVHESSDSSSFAVSRLSVITGEPELSGSFAIDHIQSCESYCFDSYDTIDFSLGPFASEMISSGDGAKDLGYYDAVMSEQAALAMGVKVGDSVLLGTLDAEVEECVPCTVKGILQCRYAMGDVGFGGDGVMLVRLPEKSDIATAVADDGTYVSFVKGFPEDEGAVTKNQELNDALDASSSPASIAVLGVLFAALLFLILSRETLRLIKGRYRTVAILCALGLDAGRFVSCVVWEELAILLLADVVALAGVRAILQTELMHVVFPLDVLIAVLLFICVIEYVLVKLLSLLMIKHIRKLEIADLLQDGAVKQ